jgi:hypothetical protein
MKEEKSTQHKKEVFQIGDGFRFGIGFWIAFLFTPAFIGAFTLILWILVMFFGSI